ncbi:MAG TPA: hypothetical protein HPP87_12290 [Planctomycetes bacterium]|nr:hypothetical protein [Planctomycetota bacterium]HIJ72120.1 hypothetical protein [Planctomycetota bacterium]
MDETLEEKRKLPHWRRILFWFVIAAMVLLAGVMLGSYEMGRRLGSEIVKISESGEPLTFSGVANANSAQILANEDAGVYYVEALGNIGPASLPNLTRIHSFYRQNMASLPAKQFPSDLRDSVSQNLSAVAGIFEKLDKAAGLPLSRFDIGIINGVEVFGTRIQRMKTVVLLLSLRTLDLILQGRDDDAANSVFSLLKMLRIFDFHPTLVVYSVKAGFLGLACEDIRLLLERGNASAELLSKLEKTLSEVVGADVLEKVFLAERVYQTEIGRNLVPKKIASRFLEDPAPDIPERLGLPGSFVGRLRLRQKAGHYFRDMARIVTASRRPWPGPLEEIFDRMYKSTKKPGKLVTSMALFTRLTAELLVAVRCTKLAVATELYRGHEGEGQLPDTLDALVPAYFDQVPLDTFTGEQLLYSRDEESYIIYSTGTNRVDDGGSIRPEEGEKAPLDRGLRIRLEVVK